MNRHSSRIPKVPEQLSIASSLVEDIRILRRLVSGNDLPPSEDETFTPNPFFKEELDFDISAIGDPVAAKTSWLPQHKGPTSFQTYRRRKTPYGVLVFQPTFAATWMLQFPMILVAAVMALQFFFGNPERFFGNPFAAAAFGGLILLIATLRQLKHASTIAFDQRFGLCYRWGASLKPNRRHMGNHSAKLADIHAIQILSEELNPKTARNLMLWETYTTHELNLVRKDGSRMILFGHRHAGIVRADALAIAKLLNVPIWDANLLPPLSVSESTSDVAPKEATV